MRIATTNSPWMGCLPRYSPQVPGFIVLSATAGSTHLGISHDPFRLLKHRILWFRVILSIQELNSGKTWINGKWKRRTTCVNYVRPQIALTNFLASWMLGC